MTGLRTRTVPRRSTVESEVRASFEAYERALIDHDVPAMDGWFLDDARTVRFGIAEEQWGADEVRRWRGTAAPVPSGRLLSDTQVTMLAPTVAVVSTCFRYPGSPSIGRQSQTWVRTEAGWRIAHAHVSERAAPT